MSQHSSPFSKQQLLPQEETLEILRQKGELFIGIPKENQYQGKENLSNSGRRKCNYGNGHRILLNPELVMVPIIPMWITQCRGEITRDTKKVFACPIILKVEPATLQEIQFINPQSTIISALQIKTQSKKYFEELAKRGLLLLPSNILGTTMVNIQRFAP